MSRVRSTLSHARAQPRRSIRHAGIVSGGNGPHRGRRRAHCRTRMHGGTGRARHDPCAQSRCGDSRRRYGTAARMLSVPNANPFPSTYAPFASRTTVIRGATILTAAGPCCTTHRFSPRRQDRRGRRIGRCPPDAVVIDGHGRYVTPGIIDVHSTWASIPRPASSELRWQRSDRSDDAIRLGRAFRLASGSVFPARASRWRHHRADPARLGESDRRAHAVLKIVPSRTVQG